MLEEWQRTGTCPQTVPVDCVGSLVGSGNTTFSAEILRFLDTLNNVSNAFKHSFINTQLSLIGAEEPVVYALGLKRNKLSNAPSFYQVTLTSLISGFNAFFSSIKQKLKECKLPHQTVQQ